MRTWMPLISTVLYSGARKSSSLSSSSSADGDTPAWHQGPASPCPPKPKAPGITFLSPGTGTARDPQTQAGVEALPGPAPES